MPKTLPKSLRNRPFTYRDARKHGITPYAISSYLAEGVAERVERGLYRATGGDLTEEDLYRQATMRAGEPAVVCLLSALSHYELTDTIPKRVWLMVEASKRIRSENIRLYRARDPRWKIGVIAKDGFSITSIERTIVDALSLKALLPVRLGIDALKKAIATKKTTASKVMYIADDLGVKHRVLPYIEAVI